MQGLAFKMLLIFRGLIMMCDFHSAMQKFIAQGFAFKMLLMQKILAMQGFAFKLLMWKTLRSFIMICAFSFCHAEIYCTVS